MRLTADVILRAQVSVNPLRERELNLRGYKAPAIENLGVTKDGFDCIDLSDNEIKKLENFPRLRRLRMLLLHNNHVAKIQENLADAVANLEYLMLTGNRIAQLAEVDRLACFAKLDTLSLAGNPVTKRKYYREYVIHKLPQLRVLDFQRIRPRDREAAATLFNSLVGQKIEQEAHGNAAPEASVAASTQAMKKVSIAQQAPAPTAIPPPPPASVAAVPPPPPPAKKQTKIKSPSPKKSEKAGAVEETASEMEVDAVDASKEEAKSSDPEPTKEAPAPATPEADVNMEDASEQGAAVAYTPSKPIDQMTVAVLRKELKTLGLSIKGLKAELVQRLKDAASGGA